MPRKSLSPCSAPGCPTLTYDSRCEKHQRQARRESDAKRGSARERGYDVQWQKFRAAFLRDHPMCEDPSGCLDSSTDVDHIDGLGPDGPRGFDPTNCRALCHRHHSRRTAKDQPGGWAAGRHP